MVNHTDFDNKFVFQSIQKMDKGSFRRYVIPEYLHSNKGNSILLNQAYDIFKNKGSFDGYSVYEIVFEFSPLPFKTFGDIVVRFDKDFLKCESYITNLIKIIDVMGLFLNLAVIWTYTNKQQGRKYLNGWRNEVLKDNVCACCGGDKHLQAHHIFGYSKYEMLRDDPSNGIVLCKWCHKKYHSYYPGDANLKDLIDFIKRFGGNHE
ncbi:hypothetical protein MBORA_15920 [Methanobrevibacter oralis]|uniref:HNH nuclease domain-containing protein n=1 Tax=Methanobrevibacter oralis TaxID=66851 RepID=A0A166C584_METOA|nr:HNH endonuclease signature motif containing protein [Methanobrevibacter oralis]KZX11347.1 hypothetical protein MBORA_15920 [Methanobrevibacter oralis]